MPDLATGAVVFVTGGAAASVEQRPSSSPPKAQPMSWSLTSTSTAPNTAASLAGRVHRSSSTSPTTRRWPPRSTPLSPSTADSTLRSTTQASTTCTRAFHDLDAASWDRMIRVNLSSVFVCMKHELRHMAAAGSGAIVNTSSGAGVVAAPGLPHYTAAKHGVVGLTKAAAQEYARQASGSMRCCRARPTPRCCSRSSPAMRDGEDHRLVQHPRAPDRTRRDRQRCRVACVAPCRHGQRSVADRRWRRTRSLIMIPLAPGSVSLGSIRTTSRRPTRLRCCVARLDEPARSGTTASW